MNEAELQANVVHEFRRVFPLIKADFRVERYLHLHLGHHKVLIDGLSTKSHSIRGRSDVVISVDNAPLILFELKSPRCEIGDLDVTQALSYARIHDPIVPITAVTNGKDTLVVGTYDGKPLDPTRLSNEQLIKRVGMASRIAMIDIQGAIHTLLGTSFELWSECVSKWNDIAIARLRGDLSEFNRPIGFDFMVPRDIVSKLKEQIAQHTQVIIVHGAPLSGITSTLVQFCETDNPSLRLFIDGTTHKDALRYIADRFALELGFPVTREEIRGWCLTSRTNFDLVVVLDNASSSTINELVELAHIGALKAVFGMTTNAFERLSVQSGRIQLTAIGNEAFELHLERLSNDEFSAACNYLSQTRGIAFMRGAEYVPDWRIVRNLRLMAAHYADNVQDRTEQGAIKVIAPFPSFQFVRRSADISVGGTKNRHAICRLAEAYLVDLKMHQDDAIWVSRHWGCMTIAKEIAEGRVNAEDLGYLERDGHLAWVEFEVGMPRILVRSEEAMQVAVSDYWCRELAAVKCVSESSEVLKRLLKIATIVPRGSVLLAGAIIETGSSRPDVFSALVNELRVQRPTISAVSEGARFKILLRSESIEWEARGDELGETACNLLPWIVLSHILSFPLLRDDCSKPENISFFEELGSLPFPIRSIPQSSIDEIQNESFHTHEIPGVGTFPCSSLGIIEPLQQAMLNHMYRYADDLIELAECAAKKRNHHLAWRLMALADMNMSSVNKNVMRASTRMKALLKPWFGELMTHLHSTISKSG